MSQHINAALIAAAPEPATELAWLRGLNAELLGALDELLPWHDPHKIEKNDNPLINRCRAALEKGKSGYASCISETHSPGITMRDYFAGLVVQGLATQPEWTRARLLNEICGYAYAVSDAMLKERSK